MSITVREILEIEPFNSFQLLSGEGGLSNVVKYTTTMELPDIRPWLSRNLLLITTGYAIKDDPHALVSLMQDLHTSGCAGLLIKKEYIGTVPQEAIDLSNQYRIPIILLPDQVPFVSLFVPLMNAISQNQDIQLQNSRLLMEVITGDLHNEQDIFFRAAPLDWPQPPLRVLIMEIAEDGIPAVSAVSPESRHITEKVSECITSHFLFQIKKSPVIPTGDGFTVITPDTGSTAQLGNCLRGIQKELASSGISLRTGVSDVVTAYSKLRQAYHDAKDALVIGKMLKDPSSVYPIRKFRLEQSFFQYKGNEALQEYFNATIGAVADYDQENHTELLKTLTELIRCMGVKSKTAEHLYLHRNTLQYRIKKIEKLTGMSLSDGENLIRLAIILKIAVFL